MIIYLGGRMVLSILLVCWFFCVFIGGSLFVCGGWGIGFVVVVFLVFCCWLILRDWVCKYCWSEILVLSVVFYYFLKSFYFFKSII